MTPRRPMWQHAAALAAILAVMLPILGRPSLISADEGAVLATVDLLHRDGSWSMTNPLPTVDPDGRWFGFEYPSVSGDRYFPYAKHAVYPAVMAPLYDLGGELAIVAASVAGTVAAAVFAALLSRRLRPGLDVATLWICGLASPLFYDSYWVIAHSIGAAFAGFAMWAGLKVALDRRVAWLPGVVVGVAGATFFRSEGMLFGLAVGVACVAIAGATLALRRRTAVSTADAGAAISPTLGVTTGALAAATAAGCWWLDGRLFSAIVGETLTPFVIRSSGDDSWVAERLGGVWSSVLRGQLQSPTLAGLIWTVIAIVAVIGAGYARWKPDDVSRTRGAAVVASVLAIVVVVLPFAPIPGLLVAFPLLPVGLVLTDRRVAQSPAAALLLATSAVFAAAVVATQYKIGGSMEWGGRFFHMALPLIVPVLVVACADALARFDATTRTVVLRSSGVVALALVLFGAGSIVRLRTMADDLTSTITDVSASTSSAHQPGGAVVVANMNGIARFNWQEATTARYLSVTEPKDLPVVARRMAAAGIDEFTFAAAVRHDSDRTRLVGYREVRRARSGIWEISVMRRVGSSSARQ